MPLCGSSRCTRLPFSSGRMCAIATPPLHNNRCEADGSSNLNGVDCCKHAIAAAARGAWISLTLGLRSTEDVRVLKSPDSSIGYNIWEILYLDLPKSLRKYSKYSCLLT